MAERRRLGIGDAFKPRPIKTDFGGGGGGGSNNVLLAYMLGQQKAGGQRQLSQQSVPGNLPQGVDSEDYRMEPKVREIGGSLVQNPEWVRKDDPNNEEADVIQHIDSTISDIENLSNELRSKNYKTGPFQWRWSNTFPGGATYMKSVGSPEEQAFKQRVDRMLQSYLLAQSGVQRGFKEISWLQSAIPNTEQFPAAFEEASKTMKEDMIRNRSNVINALRMRGKAIGGYNEYVSTESQSSDGDIETELRRLYMEGE